MGRNIYEFRLVIADKADLSLEDADALFDAGCDDATFGGRDGCVWGAFHREADSLEQAVCSAIADVSAAGFRAVRIEIEADSLVSHS